MRICRWGVLPLLCLLCSFTAFCQEDDGEGILSPGGYNRYWVVGGGGAYNEFFDQSVSAIRYQGFGPAVQLGHMKMNQTVYSDLVIQGSHTTLKRNAFKAVEASVPAYRASLDYWQLFRIKLRNERYDFRPGGIFSMNYASRKLPHLAGSGYVRESAASLGIAARMSKELELKDNRLAHLSWSVGIPLVAYYVRPAYLNTVNSLDPEDKPGKDFFANAQTSFVGKYFRVNSRLTYDYKLHNGNMLLFSYQWDYYKIKTFNTVWYAEHTLSFSLMFNY